MDQQIWIPTNEEALLLCLGAAAFFFVERLVRWIKEGRG